MLTLLKYLNIISRVFENHTAFHTKCIKGYVYAPSYTKNYKVFFILFNLLKIIEFCKILHTYVFCLKHNARSGVKSMKFCKIIYFSKAKQKAQKTCLIGISHCSANAILSNTCGIFVLFVCIFLQIFIVVVVFLFQLAKGAPRQIRRKYKRRKQQLCNN